MTKSSVDHRTELKERNTQFNLQLHHHCSLCHKKRGI